MEDVPSAQWEFFTPIKKTVKQDRDNVGAWHGQEPDYTLYASEPT